MRPLLLALLLLLALAAPQPARSARYLREVFTDATNNGNIKHAAFNKNTGKVYIGAVNRLYQLSESLVVEKTVLTGPADDNPNCPAPPIQCTCNDDCRKTQMNSYNKALLIDYNDNQLLACANLFQGRCEKRSLADVSVLEPAEAAAGRPGLVSNDERSSVVIFIAPGPAPAGSTRNVLYVAATRSSIGMNVYKDQVLAISSRDLRSFRVVRVGGFSGSTQKNIEVQQRETFRIDYKYGFSSGGFSYFLSVQKESVVAVIPARYVTRVIRVCQNDSNYYSYIEVPLRCAHNGSAFDVLAAAHVAHPGGRLARTIHLPHMPPLTDADDVLYALFSRRAAGGGGGGLTESALCVYSLRNIRSQFTRTTQQCFKGVGNTGPAYILQPSECTNAPSVTIDDNYCGTEVYNQPIAGTEAVTNDAAIVWRATAVTAIVVTVTSDYTVAFIGTDDGRLKKVVIESGKKATEYESVLVDAGSRVNPDMALDRRRKHVYVVTEKKITRVKVHDCSPHKTCVECLAANDPYCGWCSLEGRCTKRSGCSNEPRHWLSYSDSACTRIARVIPPQVQVQSVGTKAKQLQLLIQNFPQPSDWEYQCAFSLNRLTRTTTATRIGNQHKLPQENATLQCPTPLSNLLPPIPTGEDHIVMILSVRTNTKDFVTTDFTFFDCTVHTSCTDCTNSDYPCTWCIRQHQCVHNRERHCITDTIVTGKNVSGSSDKPGPEFCPRVEGSFTEILVASSTRKKVTVTGVHLVDFQTSFQCIFKIDGSRKVVDAKKIGSNIIECEPVLFEHGVPTASRNVPFQVTWGSEQHPLDNPTRIQVKVYQCSMMADSCGGCLTADTKYNCGWCSDRRCTIEAQCHTTGWLDSTAICPNPAIYSVEPLTGSVQGGTNITITGKNLGKIFDDIRNGVIVAGVNCPAYEHLYEKATRIVCQTGRRYQVGSGVVRVIVNDQYESQSANQFSYVEPKIRGFSPKQGPRSGGTRITVQGRHLNAGSSVTASVAHLPCTIVRIAKKTVVCVTSSTQLHDTAGLVQMKFDKGASIYRLEQFHYAEDPIIETVDPVKGILSGGSEIIVTGKYLDIIQEPKMVLYVENDEYISLCSVLSADLMHCPSPSVSSPAVGELVGRHGAQHVAYGFQLDAVAAPLNMSAVLPPPRDRFLLFADPVFEQFTGGTKRFQLKTEYLTINGHNLNMALTKKNVRVMIGAEECRVTSMSQTQLTCQPDPPKVLNMESSPTVRVFVGQNLTFVIGELHYEGPETRFPLAVILGISVAAVILVAVIVIVVIAYRRKSRETNLAMKRMQNQMDKLEAQVAKECKEAFAELQTDMTELTNYISGSAGGIPFRDYRSFCMSVLFPNVPADSHPVSRPSDPELEAHKRGLAMFDKMVGNKRFLLLFIHTLETDPNFSMRERVNIASLLSVCLQNRMEYHTDVLKTLLADLIQKNILANKEPKLFLRRCESVAEKMLSNWFTFLLHKFLLECAGEPLFVLFRAIKQQTDKGPVDAITSEGKYSLSEDKLIRQQIDYKPVTLNVLQSEHQYGAEPHLIKVLDCDTISQVREKLLDAVYINRPYSQRPHEDQIDLEWRTGMRGRIMLQDVDTTSKCEAECKRYNTLAHYCVLDGDWVTMIPKQNSSQNLSVCSSQPPPPSARYAIFSGSPSLSRSLTPHLETDTPVYHLVKQHNSELQTEGDRSSKMVSEIYLTRLLATKGSLQRYVDQLFQTIFSTTQRDSVLPLAIKYMFDFFDEQALYHGITDAEVVHTWKSNSLPLRFWITVVKNPDYVFDVFKSNIVDSCLSVVAQTLMDSCSMSEHCLSKDSPSSKLLYAKDIHAYKNLVERYFQEIKLMPAISDQDMNAMLAEESRLHQNDVFNLDASLFEIYQYVFRYSDKLMQLLQEDRMACNYQLARQLKELHRAMEMA